MAATFVEAPEMASTIQVPLEARRVCADHDVTISRSHYTLLE